MDMESASAQKPKPPDGIRPGQMGVVMLGHVIIGDIAATLADLATRRLLVVDEHDGEQPGWLLRPQHKQAPSYRLETLLPYERVLLEGLSRDGTPVSMSSLTARMPDVLKHTRATLLHDAVHRGWVRHVHHDQRTDAGEQLMGQIRRFQRGLRAFAAAAGDDALAGPLLPYALRFGMVRDSQLPLARFSRDWVQGFTGLPGWHVPEAARYNALDDPVPMDNRNPNYGQQATS
jgi:hypothetical protein